MRNTWVKKALIGFAVMLGAAVFGCIAGGPSPVGPPAPLAEIPSSLKFPDSIQVETPELNVAGSSVSGLIFKALAFLKNQVLPVGGEFFEAITLGFIINERTDLAVGAILLDLNDLEIPLNPVTRNFQVTGPTGGIFLGNGIKIDFADYDFFGMGSTLGCTGCTCPTGCDAPCPSEAPFEDLKPVCFRIWVDSLGDGNFVRLMAGFFEQLPFEDDPATPENEKNPGVGNYRVRLEEGAVGGGPPPIITGLGANFNHRDPQNPFDKATEYFVSFQTPLVTPLNATNSFVRVEQNAPEGATSEELLLKTVRESVNQESFGDPNFDSTFQYIARYRTDADFWSGTFFNDLLFPDQAFAEPPAGPNFTAECAQLSTAIGVDEGSCVDLGIDVTHVPFLDLLTTTDPRVNLPGDFPSTPTF